ncbi:MAG TPA: HNH endonuclease [Bacilli bacterium]|nr:HNH endonuclease [Bacilli bacterium]
MDNRLAKITKIYDVKNRDWMLYRVSHKNYLTIHHIHERVNGGKNSIDNFAPLTKQAHRNLNYMREHCQDLYEEYQQLFRDIASTKMPPTEKHQDTMRLLRIRAQECGYYEK